MNIEILIKLLKEFEYHFVGILLENDVCKYIKPPKSKTNKRIANTFKNIYLTEEYLDKFQLSLLSEEQINTLIKKYPTTHRTSKSIIKDKFIRFLQEYPDYTPEYIINIIDAYLADQMYISGTKYLYKLDNLFYKKEGKYEKSPMISLIEKYGSTKISSTLEEDEDQSFKIDEI